MATSILKQYIYQGFAINSEKITHQRFKELENEVSLLKHEVHDISKAIENKSVLPNHGVCFNGQVFDAYTFVSDLIRSAKKSIILTDNYIDDTVLTLFGKRKRGVQTLIFTSKITKQLLLDIDKFNSQYQPVEVKIFKNAHDRFLILDEKEVYHFGASLKDLGKKWFAFSKMDIDSVKVLDKISEEWLI
jgi:hypothetical protein